MFVENGIARVVQIIVHRDRDSTVERGRMVSWEKAEETDVYFLAVPDQKIAEVARAIPHSNALVIHSSGARPLAIIPRQKRGVLYPLQSFTKGTATNYNRIPFFIEASDADSAAFLEELTARIARKGQYLASAQRLQLHLAAVLGNNFVNHLLYLSQNELAHIGIDFHALSPLVDTTLQKAFAIGPRAAQTGPAMRQDRETIKTHLDLMGNKKLRAIYTAMTQSIIEAHEKEL